METGWPLEDDLSRGQLQQRYPDADDVISYEVEETSGKVVVALNGEAIELDVAYRNPTEGICTWRGKPLPFATAWVNDDLHLWLDGSLFIFQRVERQRERNAVGLDEPGIPSERATAFAQDNRRIFSGMAGRVLSVSVRPGDRISSGDEVCVLEAMKMEQIIRSTLNGIVKTIHVEPDRQVSTGDLIVELEDEA